MSKDKQYKTFQYAGCVMGLVILGMTFTACSQNLKETDVTETANVTATQDVTETVNVTEKIDMSEATDAIEAADEVTGNTSEDTLPDETDEKIEISMEDAISLGMEEASRYYDNLCLTDVHSYDNDEYIDKNAGEDGRRQWWYVDFGNEEQNCVSILICDGVIENVEHFDSNANTGLIDISDIRLTAKDAVSKAKEMGVTGGDPENKDDWASGYNFKLSYASLVESPDDRRIFLEVIGISPDGNFAHVDFDAVTGELLLAEEKIESDNGDAEWKKFE